jgi:hypothetical protein
MNTWQLDEDLLLAAFYHAEQLDSTRAHTAAEVSRRYNLDIPEHEIEKVTRALEQDGKFQRTRTGYGSLTDEGIRYANRCWGEDVSAFLEQGGAYFDDGSGFSAIEHDEGNPEDQVSELGYTSARWTGVEARANLDPNFIPTLKSQLVQLDKLVEDSALTNYEKSKAKSITLALLCLIESPEPEWKTIFRLLQSPSLAVALNIAALAQLIIGAFF